VQRRALGFIASGAIDDSDPILDRGLPP